MSQQELLSTKANFHIGQLIKLLRPTHWIKNIFVFAPLVFAGKFMDMNSVEGAVATFFVFCLAASSTYVLNDLRDIEADQMHPEKSAHRPLASGGVSRRQAIVLMGVLYVLLGLALSFQPSIKILTAPTMSFLL